MRRFLSFSRIAIALFASAGLASAMGACSAGSDPEDGGGAGSGAGAQNGTGGGIDTCPRCDFDIYVDCEGNSTDCAAQGLVCAPTLGCATCAPGSKFCVGNEVHECTDQ